MQRFAEAEAVFRKALAIRIRTKPEDWSRFNEECLLGWSLSGQKKYAEAERFLLSGYEGMKSREKDIPPSHKVRLSQTAQRLIQVYDESGKEDKAAEWRTKN